MSEHTHNHAEHTHAANHANKQETPTPVAVEVETEHPIVTQIKANFNSKVDVIDAKFFFKGKVDLKTGLEIPRRPTVEVKIPIPSYEGIIDILTTGDTTPTGKKQLELLQEAVREVIMSRARELVNENEEINQDNFPLDQLSWEAIANMPAAERRGSGISKETWEAFSEDYIAVMPAATNKAVEKVTMAAGVFVKRLANVKSEKKVLALLGGQLAIYAEASPNAAQFTEVIEFLLKKIDLYSNADSSKLLEAL